MLILNKHRLFQLGLFWVIIGFITACAPENNTFLGRRWHNVTGYYNSYFIAKERIEEVQTQLNAGLERNFNKILPLYPQFDTTVARQFKEPLDDAYKMASTSIDRHKKSKWVDDSYFLIGQARFYNREFQEAIETFKYVNTNSKDDGLRHKALIWLMRTFMDYGELNNARAVADYLRKEKLDKDNLREYSKSLAHYYYLREDWPQMAAYLAEAAKRSNKKEGRARLYFTLGQLLQNLNQDEQAYAAYQRSLKANPDYELSFYARLNAAQVADLAQESDARQIRKYFAKLIKDKKNIEYRDKIYYELGNFEARQQNYTAALANYKKSIEVSVNNPRQKSYAYRKLAEAYYDSTDYRLSSAYYDSVANSLPNDETDYEMLQERQKVMADLVTQLNTIEQTDSLLNLANMDSTELLVVFDNMIAEEERQARILADQQEREARRITQTNVSPGFNTVRDNFGLSGEEGNVKWYFYNQSLVGIGQAEFVKNWGNRALEDNWRTSRSGRINTDVITQAQAESSFNNELATENRDEQIANRRNQFFASLPTSAQAQQQALIDVETAYYNLGNIFNYNLKAYPPSIQSYGDLLNRFPATEYSPEVLFNLYRLYINVPDSAKANEVKNILLENHPNTSYAQILRNPNWQEENDKATAYLKTLYAQAYQLQRQQAYIASDSVLNIGLSQYPDNKFTDHLMLLRVINIGYKDSTDRYREQLESFIESYPESTLTPYAQELLAASKNFSTATDNRQGNAYSQNFDQAHYFILLYKNDRETANKLLSLFDTYHEEQGTELNATNILLDKERALIFVSQFIGRSEAIQYLRALERSQLLNSGFEGTGLIPLVISKENFEHLYKSKNVEGYSSFYNKYYN